MDRAVVSAIERHLIDDLRVGEARAVFAALDATLTLTAFREGAALDRLLDEVHARLVGEVVRILVAEGWIVHVEVTFSVDFERGSIDVLAWHPEESALLVVEVKSELPGIDPLLRPLEVKVRVAPRVALDRFGWEVVSVSRIVVMPEDRTARRHVDRHDSVLRAALPARSRQLRSWLRNPFGTVAGIWFLTTAAPARSMRNPSSIKRVRRPRAPGLHPQDVVSASTGISPDDARRLIDPHNVGGDSS